MATPVMSLTGNALSQGASPRRVELHVRAYAWVLQIVPVHWPFQRSLSGFRRPFEYCSTLSDVSVVFKSINGFATRGRYCSGSDSSDARTLDIRNNVSDSLSRQVTSVGHLFYSKANPPQS